MNRPNRDLVASSPKDRFELLYARHAPAILAYALRRTDAVTAQDVAAEVFAIAWRRVEDLPAEGAVLPWLYATARRVLANERRTQRRKVALAARAAEASVGAVASEPNDSRNVLEALADLPEEQREVLMLAAWEELDGRQAAAALGCSPTAYRIRLYRARRSLRDRLNSSDAETSAHVHLSPRVKELS